MTIRQSTKERGEGSIRRLRRLQGVSFTPEGLTGPLFQERASLSLHLWHVRRGPGQRGVLVRVPNRNPGVSLGCLSERVEASRGLWGRPSGQPQVRENLDDYGGIFNGGEDGQRSTALRADGDVDR